MATGDDDAGRAAPSVDAPAGLHARLTSSLPDRRGRLDEAPFRYRATKDAKVFIAWHGRTVTTLTGDAARRFLARIAGGDDHQAQLLMARATGHFKHGNER